MVNEHIAQLIELPETRPSLQEGEALCRRLALSHYENFTVVSRLIPRRMRQPLYNLYAFCRTVDDIGDEAPGDRNVLLDRFEGQLSAAYEGKAYHPVLVALQATVNQFDLPHNLFQRLIIANKMDQEIKSYRTFADLLNYCEHSATPVGRLFLRVFGYQDEKLLSLSDHTCIALQLTNFWQDVKRDHEQGRIYIPADEMDEYGVDENDLSAPSASDEFKSLMCFQVERARLYFRKGFPLVNHIHGLLRVDIALFSRGGLAILDKVERLACDTLRKRPTLSKIEKIGLFLSTLVTHRWERWT